ncbi:MAG: alpha-L-rhamnosidase N-terminal domain-containing protein, partial [Candidatus Nanopelagicales bacterium]
MELRHPAPFGARWRARWIWDRSPALRLDTATRMVLDDPTDHVALLRREVEIESVPAFAPARIWTDGRYVLRVNGTEVARGPVRSDPRAAHYDVVDLAPHLVEGSNVIAIVARHFGVATSWWMPAPPTYSMGAGSLVFEALIDGEWTVTDRDWRTAPESPWTPVEIPGDVACLPLEAFDARRYPSGWDLPGFDASGWPRAREITPFSTGGHGDPHPPSEPFGMLRPPVRVVFPEGAVQRAELIDVIEVEGAPLAEDPVRQVLADEASHLASVGTGESRSPVLLHRFDLGRIAAGTVRLSIRGAADGTIIDLAAAEHLDDQGMLVTLG